MPDYRPINDLLEIIGDYEMELVGSTAILGRGADIDIAVKMFIRDDNEAADREEFTSIIRDLSGAGCNIGGGVHYEAINLTADDQFTSLRRGEFNLLLCFNERSWNRFTKGRDFCILLQDLGVDVRDKAVRVAIHGMANHGNIALVRGDLARLPARQPVRADIAVNRAEGIADLVEVVNHNTVRELLDAAQPVMDIPLGRWFPVTNPRPLAEVGIPMGRLMMDAVGARGNLVIMDDVQHD